MANAIELVTDHREPINWVAEGLLRRGLHGLAAGSSVGKSTLLRDLITSAVLGEPLFGLYPVPRPVTVLYCVTEEEKADVARELERQFLARGAELSPNLHVYTEFPAADGGGLAELGNLIEDLAAELVIMDMFTDFVPISGRYNGARPIIKAWNDRVKAWNVCMIGTLHTDRVGIPMRGPWLKHILGSVGGPGAMTVRMGLARDDSGTLLRVTGKGVEDHDMPLTFDPETHRFRAADAPADSLSTAGLTMKRRLILDAVALAGPDGITAPVLVHRVRQLAEERRAPIDLDMVTYDNLRQVLYKMTESPSVPLTRRDGRYYTEGA